MEGIGFVGEIVWRPSPELIAQSNLQHFITAHGLRSLPELQRRSTSDISWFWNAVLHDLDIRFRQPYAQIVDLSRGKPWANIPHSS
jgi:acetyl-CoA synthetase